VSSTSKFIFLVLFIMTSMPAMAASRYCKHDRENFRCVEYLRNYDGDTITFSISDLHPLLGEEITVRVMGVDTAEKATHDLCEKEVAKIAQAYVQKKLEKAHRIDLVDVSRGKYFRIIADVIYDGHSLAIELLRKKFGEQYDGGTKPRIDWCARLKELR
jgi:micrococcal nuclease